MSKNNHRHFALYGNTKIERAYCQECQGFAFVRGSFLACCDFPASEPTRKAKRMVEAEGRRKIPSPIYKRAQLEYQENKCFYCNVHLGGYAFKNGRAIKLKIHWDHLVPYSYSQNNKPVNFVASCHICNMLKHSLMFQTTEEARAYVYLRREEKGYL